MPIAAVRLNHAVHAAPVERLDLPGEVRRWSGRRTAGRVVEEPGA